LTRAAEPGPHTLAGLLQLFAQRASEQVPRLSS